MKGLRLLLLILLFPFIVLAKKQPYFAYFNSDEFWQKLVLESPATPLKLSADDTAIIVASNRKPGSTPLRFMSEVRGNGTIRYFVVYLRGDKWHVYPVASINEAIQALPDKNKDWVVYTEGMGKIFTTDLDRGIGMAQQYDVNVLLFDYPSIHTKYKAYRNYRFVMRNSTVAYRDFAPVMDTLRRLRENGQAGKGALTLFYHSMGNNVIRRIAQTKYLNRYNDAVWVDNLIMNAPCVPVRASARWIDSIRFAKHIYIHYNPYDFTLKWARIAGFRRILGERPRGPLATNATYVNFNPLCGAGHSNFLNLRNRQPANQAAVRHYQTLLHGRATEDTLMYRRSAYRNIGLDLLPPNQ